MGGQFDSGRNLTGRIGRFGIVGLLSTGLYFVFYLLLLALAPLAPPLASVTAYVLVVPLNFVAQRSFTFRSSGAIGGELYRYLAVTAIGLATSFCAVWVTSNWLALPAFVGGLATMALVPVVTFVLMELWVFLKS